MRRPSSPTAASSALAPKSGSRPAGCTPAARWDWCSSRRSSTWCAEAARPDRDRLKEPLNDSSAGTTRPSAVAMATVTRLAPHDLRLFRLKRAPRRVIKSFLESTRPRNPRLTLRIARQRLHGLDPGNHRQRARPDVAYIDGLPTA